MDEEKRVGVTVWDSWDKVSWAMESFFGQGSAFLWDDGWSRKPAYYTVAQVSKSAAANGTRGGMSMGPNSSSHCVSAIVASTCRELQALKKRTCID